MSYFLRVLCKSKRRLTVGAAVEFLEEGVYFDPPAKTEASPSQEPQTEFDSIEITNARKKRPIILTSIIGNDIEEELAELAEIAKESGAPVQLRKRIAATQQIVALEIDHENLTDDAWAFCDSFEAYVASELDGIVYAQDDGFYDQRLQLIHRM